MGSLLKRAQLARLRPSAGFPISANDSFVKRHCNLTNEFEWGAPLLNLALLPRFRREANFETSANRGSPN